MPIAPTADPRVHIPVISADLKSKPIIESDNLFDLPN